MPETFYSILGCSQNSTYEEIKRNYKRLVKEHHPDKQTSQLYDKFLKIDEAWKTLRHEDLRRKYDALLVQNQFCEYQLVYAKLNINELQFDDNLLSSYPCRCGNSYVIDKESIIDGEYIIECDECSYVIIVNNKSN